MAQTDQKKRDIPDGGAAAFSEVWDRVAADTDPVPLKHAAEQGGRTGTGDGGQADTKSDAEKFMDRLRERMEKYPEWFEQNPTAFAKLAADDAEALADALRKARSSTEKTLVMEVPFFSFNHLIDEKPYFVHGALHAFDSAKRYAKGRMKQAFLDCAHPRLRIVLEQLEKTGWVVSFTERPSTEHKGFLQVWVERPPSRS